ncbi:MAG: IS1595 family transposase [Candidatus Hodarchaeota archaeon]
MNITEIYRLFPDDAHCLAHLEKVRWNDVPRCPYCKSPNTNPMPKEKRYHCNNCNTSYSVTVGTIFHHTHLPLQKWFLALCLILNARKGLSARQLSRDLRVNKNTAWRMGIKIRDAMMEREQRTLLTGIVEIDETYTGGKPRKGTGPHKRGRSTLSKAVGGIA